MKWKGRRSSTNVEDARGRRMGGRGVGGLGTIINVVLRLFGVKGILILAVLGIAAWQFGLIDPAALMGGGGRVQKRRSIEVRIPPS